MPLRCRSCDHPAPSRVVPGMLYCPVIRGYVSPGRVACPHYQPKGVKKKIAPLPL